MLQMTNISVPRIGTLETQMCKTFYTNKIKRNTYTPVRHRLPYYMPKYRV